MIASVAEKDRVRPWLGDIPKWQETGLSKSQTR
jgi:hypothetical protein